MFEPLDLDSINPWVHPPYPAIVASIDKYYLRHYKEIEADSPNLCWLFTLIVESGIALPSGETIAAMKHRLLSESSITPLAWRFLANGRVEHFRVVDCAQDPLENREWRWELLIAWLQVLTGLHHTGWYKPVPVAIQELFLHDGLAADPEAGELQFRGAWMSFQTLHAIFGEAERRLASKTFANFVRYDLPVVLTWLAEDDPQLESNQIKAGWSFLMKSAITWREDVCAQASYSGMHWYSPVQMLSIGSWVVQDIVDGCALRRHAISQRVCAYRFIDGCFRNQERIFSISDHAGEVHATLRLSRSLASWEVTDLKSFANTSVADEIKELCEDVAFHYNCAWMKASCEKQ